MAVSPEFDWAYRIERNRELVLILAKREMSVLDTGRLFFIISRQDHSVGLTFRCIWLFNV